MPSRACCETEMLMSALTQLEGCQEVLGNNAAAFQLKLRLGRFEERGKR